MAHTVTIPTLLRKVTGEIDTIEVDAKTVREAIDILEDRFPGFRSRICDDSGELRRFINIYLNGEDLRFLDNLSTSIPDRAEISIIPAIAGG
jgi:sulfur-carrier protein